MSKVKITVVEEQLEREESDLLDVLGIEKERGHYLHEAVSRVSEVAQAKASQGIKVGVIETMNEILDLTENENEAVYVIYQFGLGVGRAQGMAKLGGLLGGLLRGEPEE